MTAIVTSACIGLSGSAREACSKALEAGSKQSGIEQDVDTFQKNVEKQANNEAHEYFGDTGVEVLGSSLFLLKTVIDKSVRFNAPTFGLCDSVTNQVGPNDYKLLLEWKF